MTDRSVLIWFINKPELNKLNDYQSLGLPGMFERVRLIGGKLEIKGATGEGTTVRVNIPFVDSH